VFPQFPSSTFDYHTILVTFDLSGICGIIV
jgi:hypothetical protein